MKIPVSVRLSELSLKILGGEGEGVAADLERAIRVYLSDSGTSNPGWPYPVALGLVRVRELELELRLDESVWEALEEEAAAQEVSASQMASHAVLYYAAELDAGRVTRRILDGIEDEDAE
jgi:hypothetical protein